ncbi:MAG: prepilin peptidase [Nitrosopumilaceae archaeon]|nr:prepilin peptidase [Nitrosopumilaceae archaeon]
MIPPDALPYMEDGRMLAVACMLAINAYTDLKHREVAGRDRHYAAAGAVGGFVFLVFGGGWQDLPALFSMVAGITASLALWRCRVLSTGDCIVLAVVSVMLPSYGVIYFVPVVIAMLSIMMLALLLPMYNFVLNVLQPISASGRPLFDAYPRAGAWKRAACMFTAHHKRPWEKYVVPVWEDGDGSFSVRHTVPFDRRDWDAVGVGRLVVVVAPVVPFFLTAFVLVVAVAAWSAAP